MRSALYNPLDFGASGDGQTDDTHALQAALDACAAQGGGTVWVPAGRYVSGSLFLHSHLDLHLDAGAVLLGSQDPAAYPVIESRWEGAQQPVHAAFINGQNLENVSISGPGTLDGRGETWWRAYQNHTLDYPRPRLVAFSDCRNVRLQDFTACNSPAWTINPVRCENVTIQGLTITNPPDSPNTDGINPDSCRRVLISGCRVSVGDDCITLKAGTQFEQPEHRAACRDIIITGCILERGHGGIVIGSEMSGDVTDVLIANCIFLGTDRGLRFKSRRGRGGVVENIRAANLLMDRVLCPVTINLYYHCNGAQGDPTVADKNPRPVDAGTPAFRRIHISQVSAVGVRLAAGFLYGLAELPLEDITFSDISFAIAPGAEPAPPEMADDIPSLAQAGLFIRNARRVRLSNVQVSGQIGPAFDLDSTVEAEIV